MNYGSSHELKHPGSPITKPRVTAAIVTYNKKEATLNLLSFLEAHKIPTFITENASMDGTRNAIRERFPHISLLESEVNLGGTGGFNCAVLAALSTGSEYIVLLDDDVLPQDDCIEKLADFLDAHEEYVFAAPAIYIASKPDTLQETGGGVDFSSSIAVEAWHRFNVNPDLPEYIDIDYASACCLMVRTEAIRKLGVMDWNYFIFSDDVDWSLRLRETFGKGACVTTIKAMHDFPWAKPFSPMRLYFFRRNFLYLISRLHKKGSSLLSLRHELNRLFRDGVYSWVIGDHEIATTLRHAFFDAWKYRYGKWANPVQFGAFRKKLDPLFFRKHKIRRILLDITIEDFDTQAMDAIRSCSEEKVTVDVLCDGHRMEVYTDKGIFSKVYGRSPRKREMLKTLFRILLQKYDLVITDACMAPRRPTSMVGRHAAFFHDGALYQASNRLVLACLAYIGSRIAGRGLSRITYGKFLNKPPDGIPSEDAGALLEHIGVDPNVGQPWSRVWDLPFTGSIPTLPQPGKSYTPPVSPPFLGPAEKDGGYHAWCLARDHYAPVKYASMSHGESTFFSILVPVRDPQTEWLQECIDSVRSQAYKDWELILSDDASQMEHVKSMLKEAESSDTRIHTIFNNEPAGISRATNRAANMAKGEYLVFLDHDDILDVYALSAFAQTICDEKNKRPVDILYADEDRFDDLRMRKHPGFKPQYSPDLLLATNYIHHPLVIRRDLFIRLQGFRSQYDGSQDHDLLLRAVEVCRNVVHIRDVLYHMRIHQGSLSAEPLSKPKAHERDRQLISETLERRGIRGKVSCAAEGIPGHHVIRRELPENISVTVLIIPEGEMGANDFSDIWEGCECLIGQNDTSVSKTVNELAGKAKGDVLIIASSQIRVHPGWKEAMVPHILRPDIGLVTGKLVYHDNRLNSCGLVLGIAGAAGRWHHGCNASDPGYVGWMALDHEVSAVPWRFMGIRRDLFEQTGQFDIAFIKQGFDIDLALRLRTEKDLRHLAIPGARAVFTEDFPEYFPEKWQIDDLQLLWFRWGKVIRQGDPYFNPNLSLYNEDVYFVDEQENDLRSRGVFAAYDAFTAELLGQRFPGRLMSE